MIRERYLNQFITTDLKEKMVFVGGPRQVGKTTMSKHIGVANYLHYAYFNWDNRGDRKNILNDIWPADADLLIFDEIHKYKLWKNNIKGLFDKYKEHFHILVTGSARLDLYRRGGDSLFGRYHYYRLHPFSVREVLQKAPVTKVFEEPNFLASAADLKLVFNNLLIYGGFPEPFLKQDEAVWRRFQNERLERLIKEDVRDIEAIRDLSLLQTLVEILPRQVGSLFSLNSLREDLQVAHKTITHWVEVLEKFYLHFRIYPFASTRIKSLRHQPKLYFWDWSSIEDHGAKLENMVASHLLKFVHLLQDAFGYKAELQFLRDVEGREVDFLITVDKKPWLAVEVKSSYQSISSGLKYFGAKLKIPFQYQLVETNGMDAIKDGVRVMSVDKFLSGLA